MAATALAADSYTFDHGRAAFHGTSAVDQAEPHLDVFELCALSTDILKTSVPQSGTPRRVITAAQTRLSGSAFHRLRDVPSDEWESCWTLHLRSAPAALREEEAHHLGGGVGASRIGVRPDWASPVPRVPAAMDRPGFSDDDVVDVTVRSACARMAGGPLVDVRRV